MELLEPSIAYVASTFPARSETFVYREVRALRERRCRVYAASLYAPQAEGELADLVRDLSVVYDREGVLQAGLETLERPLRVLSTLRQAALDALFPGEALGLEARLKLPLQAWVSVGLARRLRHKNVRHIHCHFAHAPTSIGMYAAAHLEVPFSFTGHANDLFQRRGLLRKKLLRARFVACISRFHRELYTGLSPEGADKYRVIRCGVDLERWEPRPVRPEGARLEVLTVCRLVDKKGVDTAIRAMACLERPARLTIAGDGPERARLEALIEELGCKERVRLLGAVDNETVRRLMQEESHVFVLPCRTDRAGDRDGLPVVLIEAMASGLPVVSGDLPAIRELVEHDVNGILVPPDDPQSLAAALTRLDSKRREALGRAARATVEREFSLHASVEQLLAEFTGTGETRSAARPLADDTAWCSYGSGTGAL